LIYTPTLAVILLRDKAAIAPTGAKAHCLPFKEDNMLFWIVLLEMGGTTQSGNPSSNDSDISLYLAGERRIGSVLFR
jgi:hypothetical protein